MTYALLTREQRYREASTQLTARGWSLARTPPERLWEYQPWSLPPVQACLVEARGRWGAHPLALYEYEFNATRGAQVLAGEQMVLLAPCAHLMGGAVLRPIRRWFQPAPPRWDAVPAQPLAAPALARVCQVFASSPEIATRALVPGLIAWLLARPLCGTLELRPGLLLWAPPGRIEAGALSSQLDWLAGLMGAVSLPGPALR